MSSRVAPVIEAAAAASTNEPLFLVPPTSRPVSMLRHEVKFVLADADLGKVRAILRSNGRRVEFGTRVSRLHTLYFDDPNLSACYDNLDGLSVRSKLRLRWYGSDETRLFLEKKSRVRGFVDKERLPIEAATPIGALSYARLREELIRVLPTPWRERLLARPEPTLINTYEREYFEAREGGARVTLDSRIAFYGQRGALRLRRAFPMRPLGLAILEVKLGEASPNGLGRALFPLELVRSRSSKYVLGCRMSGLVAEARSTS